MELRQLETFRVVMSTLNMTMAAERIFLSPAAVSLQIKHLSDELGGELFTRAGRTLVPTKAAELLQQPLEPLTRVLRQIHEDFPSKMDHDTRPFVLATGLTTLLYQLPRPLKQLRKKFPRNDIQVQIGATEKILVDLEYQQIDLGIVSLPVEAPSVELTPLFKEEMVLLAHHRAAAKWGKKMRVEDMPKLRMILYPSGATRAIIDRLMQRHGISLNVVMEVDDTEAIKKLVEAGFGASILPQSALKGASLLKIFSIEGDRPCREVALARPRSPYPRKLTADIAIYLKDQLSNRFAQDYP